MTKLAAVFDLDGTLLDTIDDLAYAVNTALTENGFPTHSARGILLLRGKRCEDACAARFAAECGQSSL